MEMRPNCISSILLLSAPFVFEAYLWLTDEDEEQESRDVESHPMQERHQWQKQEDRQYSSQQVDGQNGIAVSWRLVE